MKRPLAYVCSPYRGDVDANIQKARDYCRQVYDLGYTPIAPHLLFPQFVDDNIPEERKAGLEMGNLLLRRCHVLVVCGHEITEGMLCEIMLAHRLQITATTLEGLLTVKCRAKVKERS